VYIEGKLRTRSYDDKEGITRYVTEIEADTLTLIGGRPDGDNSGGGGQQTQAQPQQQKAEAKKPAAAKNLQPDSADDESFDDLPF